MVSHGSRFPSQAYLKTVRNRDGRRSTSEAPPVYSAARAAQSPTTGVSKLGLNLNGGAGVTFWSACAPKPTCSPSELRPSGLSLWVVTPVLVTRWLQPHHGAVALGGFAHKVGGWRKKLCMWSQVRTSLCADFDFMGKALQNELCPKSSLQGRLSVQTVILCEK